MKSKRFIFTIVALLLNFILYSYAMYRDMDVVAVGTGLALLNAPLYGYITGETLRKSEKQ
jgi:hypothetical protein